MKLEKSKTSGAGPMGKIFLLVGLAVVMFMAFSAYSVQKEIQGSAQLAAIKDRYEALATERADLAALRKSSYDEFVATLKGSEQDARVRLIMGLALGVMNLGFMAVLVYFIRNNVNTIGVIAEQNATLEKRVAERTAQLSQKTNDINAMLQNMKLGVSTLRELELASAKQKEELDIIARIIRISVGKFNDFVESATAFVAANRRLIETHATGDTEAIAALFRNMHTIKGNARTFEFTHITDAAHRAEQTYDQLRKNADAKWDPELLQTELDVVEAAIGRYITVNEDKLGRKGRASDLLTTRGSFVSNEQLAELRAMAAALVGSPDGADIRKMHAAINNLGLIPLQRLVSGSVDSLSSLANELKKPTPTVDIGNGDFSFNSQFAEALKSSFMHILRNSLDHGIEPPDERRQAHKPMQGKVQFVCRREGDHVQLHVSDDGRGLALHKLYEKGLAAGLFKPGEPASREAIAEVIFESGLSTSERLTQVSGRGVGMEAVRTFLEEQGASIGIVLGNATQELGFTPFKFVIDIPPAAYQHAA